MSIMSPSRPAASGLDVFERDANRGNENRAALERLDRVPEIPLALGPGEPAEPGRRIGRQDLAANAEGRHALGRVERVLCRLGSVGQQGLAPLRRIAAAVEGEPLVLQPGQGWVGTRRAGAGWRRSAPGFRAQLELSRHAPVRSTRQRSRISRTVWIDRASAVPCPRLSTCRRKSFWLSERVPVGDFISIHPVLWQRGPGQQEVPVP